MLIPSFKLTTYGSKMRSQLLISLAILGWFRESRFAQADSPDRERMNILSIVTDDQAAWTLSCYGGKELLTPNIDRIASEGARFTNAFVATPVCSPSRATFLTGLYGTQLGITDFIAQQDEAMGLGLRSHTVTWPEILKGNGYATALMGKWHLGREPTQLPSQFGFDRFYGFLGAATFPMTPVFDFPEGRRKLDGCSADLICDEAIAFIKTQGDQPFALCLHFREPHEPYGPMPDVDTQSLAMLDPVLPDAPGLDSQQVKQWRREYLTAVHAIDRSLGRVLKALEEQGLWERTVILFTSDHGYNIGEHTVHGKGNATWVAAGMSGPRRPNLWDTSLKVPLMVRWPSQKASNVVIESLISSVDICPSVLGMLGVQSPKGWKHEGIDFSPLLRGLPYSSRETFFSQYDMHHLGFAQMRSARNAKWKLVRHFESHLLDEFYDLTQDPDEHMNLLHWGAMDKLTAEQKHAFSDLDKELHAWMVSIGDPLLAHAARQEEAK